MLSYFRIFFSFALFFLRHFLRDASSRPLLSPSGHPNHDVTQFLLIYKQELSDVMAFVSLCGEWARGVTPSGPQ